MSSKDEKGAKKAFELLATINPNAKCQLRVNELFKSIETKLTTEEKKQWDLAMKIYQDDLNITKSAIKAYRDIAVEYAKSQPKTITFNNIMWR
jgi:predicted transposase YbfD/YdcC